MSTEVKLLTKEQFKQQVFLRDKHTCVFCSLPAVDPHHILERKLWPDGGFYLDNGASVCSDHHMQCEMTLLSVEIVRSACGIREVLLPPGFASGHVYDKWGNEVLEDHRLPGPLFFDDGCQKILKRAGLIHLFR